MYSECLLMINHFVYAISEFDVDVLRAKRALNLGDLGEQ